MADVRFERKKALSRGEAAVWLAALAKGLSESGDVVLPVGGGGVVTLRPPPDVRAEFEVEVEGDQVEVEVELTWRLSSDADADADEVGRTASD